ncbi:MAG: DUF3109 family protein [Prevotella sp.]|jgi:hypothetical protein|nr:DUF3109 family protein [Prevotella sp.]
MVKLPPILEVGGILISSDILTEKFCCDLSVCKGVCCVEGDAGAPVTMDEIGEIEECLDDVWNDLSAQAQAVIDRQGVAYTDQEGDLVTSIVGGKDCVFTCYDNICPTPDSSPDMGGECAQPIRCCLCALEKAYRAGRTHWCKPVSCALYPIRVKQFADGTVALNYNRWKICESAIAKGKALQLPLYRFLEEPLKRRFGETWYQELCEVADELRSQGYL